MAKKKTIVRRKRSGSMVLSGLADAPTAATGALGVFERMARNPDLTVGELGELIKFHERQEEREAAKAFDAAYRVMQPEIPRIKKKGAIRNREKVVQSRYSKYEDIRAVVDPILRRHGFTFHTKTERLERGLQVVGVLEHEGGGKRTSEFPCQADESGGKNAIQGLGSAVSYGKRYTLKDLLAIIEEGEDDDAQTFGKAQRQAPAGVVDVVPVQRAAGYDAGKGAPINDKQLRRFHVIAGNSGRGESEIRLWLERRFGWTSSRQITVDKYDVVCSAIEAPGTLPG